MKRIAKRVIALGLAIILTFLLAGCSNGQKPVEQVTETVSITATLIPTVNPAVKTDPPMEAATEMPENSSTPEPSVLTDEQANSINMLNYLAALTREILKKKNNRVFIEQTVNSLYNDINPSKLDELTVSHYNELLDDLHKFDQLLTKRERLKYLFEQNQAQAMRQAIPNPLGLLSAVKSMNIVSLVSSVAYMAVDAVAGYQSAMSAAEQEYLQDSWELDDSESDTIHSLRKQTFLYMVEVVRKYGLPDKLTLSEEKVDNFVDWQQKDYKDASPESKVLFYSKNESEYKGFGQYWIARAIAHYDNKEYDKCLNSIKQYEDLKIGIFRKDYEFAKVLPVAIGAAKETLNNNDYIQVATRYVKLILDNTNINDWPLRYFAAQTALDLYSLTEDRSYIDLAFETARDNVNELIAEQRKLNEKYVNPVALETVPGGSEKAKEEKIKKYNEQLKKDRETELPPVYEPLRLNCDLLFAIMDRFEYSIEERRKVDRILFDTNDTLFFTQPLNSKYKMYANERKYQITFDGKTITLPVSLLSPNATVRALVYDQKDKSQVSQMITDWVITKVERKGNTPDSFIATYYSKTAESVNYNNVSKIEIDVFSLGGSESFYNTQFRVKHSKNLWVFDNNQFEKIK